jgi:hypothetical protein
MAMKGYTLSEAATRASNLVLLDEDFASDAASIVVDDVVAYLSELTYLREEEARLKWELEALPDLARQRMSGAITAARRSARMERS